MVMNRPVQIHGPEQFDKAANPPDQFSPQGLSTREAANRLRSEGYNELPSSKPPSLLRTAANVMREPMLLLLAATGAVYVLLGNPAEAIAVIIAVVLVISITIYEERKTERALHALRDLSSPRALVIRQGSRERVPGREVVRGDLVVLSEGDRVPADAVVLEARNLQVDESLLTGESVPVDKTETPAASQQSARKDENSTLVFSGSMVVRGKGTAEVVATGSRTELGKIGKSIQEIIPEGTRLQQETRRLVRVFAVIGIALCIVVALVYAYTRGSLLQGALAGLTLGISMVPEEFPVVLTIFLALGAWRIARQQVLARRMPAIETLGSATVLCVDKTGTLTMNRMQVQALFSVGEIWRLPPGPGNIPETFRPVLEFSILASSRDPFDPMERALLDAGERLPGWTNKFHADWKLLREYPLSTALLAMSRAWQNPGEQASVIAAKGAPEAILELCRLQPSAAKPILAATQKLASSGLRVIGVAVARASADAPLPADQHLLPFGFVGLVGLADPVRPAVPAAVKTCYRAGVRVVMVTGDYSATAQNVAEQIGLQSSGVVMTGSELEFLDPIELRECVKSVNIFARVLPDQKLRLVRALQANNEVVAMTGDGVNDAPALKAADIGIAMGKRGTDVAREAASLVLLDDDFSSIVNAIRMGRRIYDNLKKATAYVLAVHVPIAGLALLPLLFGWPLILMPLHVLFVELIIDPTSSVAFEAEPEEADVMDRAPRSPRERLFSRGRVSLSLFQGFTVLLSILVVFGAALYRGHDESDCRTLAFSTLVVGNLALIFANRSWSRTVLETFKTRNRALWLVTVAALITLSATIYIPPLRALFHFSALHPVDLVIAAAAGFAGILWFELLKLFGVRVSHQALRMEWGNEK
jgi:P-type Ca2+ transporter type 2C